MWEVGRSTNYFPYEAPKSNYCHCKNSVQCLSYPQIKIKLKSKTKSSMMAWKSVLVPIMVLKYSGCLLYLIAVMPLLGIILRDNLTREIIIPLGNSPSQSLSPVSASSMLSCRIITFLTTHLHWAVKVSQWFSNIPLAYCLLWTFFCLFLSRRLNTNSSCLLADHTLYDLRSQH